MPSRNYSYKFNGFTLLEITMSLILLSILTISIIPKFFDFTEFKSNLLAKKLHNSLRQAQITAIGSGCHIAVAGSSNALILTIRHHCTNGVFDVPFSEYTRSENTNSVTSTANNIELSYNNFPIYFDHNGQIRLVANNELTNASLTINYDNSQHIIYLDGEHGQIN